MGRKKKVITILRVLISLILLAIVIKFANIDNVVKSLKNFNPVWLLPIFILILLSVIVSAWKWDTLIKAQKVSIRYIDLFIYYNCGLFFNNFLPSSIGGDGIRIYLAGKKGGSYSVAASSVVMERTLATVSLAFLGVISAVFAKEPSGLAVLLLFLLFIMGVLLTSVLILGWVPAKLKKREGKISKAWVSFAHSASELKQHKKALLYCFLESLLFQVIVALVIGAIMKGFNQSVPSLPDLFLITSASSVLAMVPLGINGFGMREGAYIYLLKPFGYTTSEALTVSILFAFFVTIYSMIGGFNWIYVRGNARNTEGNLEKIN